MFLIVLDGVQGGTLGGGNPARATALTSESERQSAADSVCGSTARTNNNNNNSQSVINNSQRRERKRSSDRAARRAAAPTQHALRTKNAHGPADRPERPLWLRPQWCGALGLVM